MATRKSGSGKAGASKGRAGAPKASSEAPSKAAAPALTNETKPSDPLEPATPAAPKAPKPDKDPTPINEAGENRLLTYEILYACQLPLGYARRPGESVEVWSHENGQAEALVAQGSAKRL